MPRQRTSINIDAQLWRRFKASLALEGRDMSPVIERWIEEYLDRLQARPTASRVETNGMEPRTPAGATAQD